VLPPFLCEKPYAKGESVPGVISYEGHKGNTKAVLKKVEIKFTGKIKDVFVLL
jgi:hypothetical protein